VIEVPEGSEFVCPEPNCAKVLQPGEARGKNRGMPKPSMLVGGAVALIVVVASIYALRAPADSAASDNTAKANVPKTIAPTQPIEAQGTEAQRSGEASAQKAVLTATFKNGLGYASQRMYDNALKEFAVVEKGNSAFPGLQMNMGVAYMQLHRFEPASDHLSRALQQTPGDPNVEYNLACLYSLTGKLDDAVNALKAAVALGFSDASVIKNEADLRAIHRHPGFKAVLQQVTAKGARKEN